MYHNSFCFSSLYVLKDLSTNQRRIKWLLVLKVDAFHFSSCLCDLKKKFDGFLSAFFFLVCFFYYYSNINTHTPDLFRMSFSTRRRREKYKKKSLEYNYYSVWKSIEEKGAKRICFVFNWNEEEKKANGKWNANKNKKKFTWIVWLFLKNLLSQKEENDVICTKLHSTWWSIFNILFCQ